MMTSSGAQMILDQMERELIPIAKAPIPEGVLYHYTDAFGLDGIMRQGVVRATHYRFMNDRTELEEGRRVVLDACAEVVADDAVTKEVRAIVQEFANAFANPAIQDVTRDIFIASFSEKGDDLGQWRAYGNRGAGYAIGIKFVEGKADGPPDDRLLGFLLPCEYDRVKALGDFKAELLEVSGQIHRYGQTYVAHTGVEDMWRRGMVLALRRLARHWLSIKNEHFRAEHEWRYISLLQHKKIKEQLKTRPSATRGTIPYVELPLSSVSATPPLDVEEIIVGPTHDPDSGVLGVRLLLESIGYEPAVAERIVKRSKVPFRG